MIVQPKRELTIACTRTKKAAFVPHYAFSAGEARRYVKIENAVS
jgi:hypothetical protein